MLIAKTLSYYKRADIRSAITSHSQNKEISVRYATYFGKRPEIIYSDGDVLEFAKNKATSFHCSEELWSNPLRITTGMSDKDVCSLRTGWDLILDIDCPYWPLSKLITHLFVKALKAHNITSISVKFSGNKGFHIAVPFEAFPTTINSIPTKDLFPQAPRRIAYYLLDYIARNEVREEEDFFIVEDKRRIKKSVLAQKLGMTVDQFYLQDQSSISGTLLCRICGHTSIDEGSSSTPTCPRCSSIMSREEPSLTPRSSRVFNPLSIIEVDTVLIAHRHLYRAPYSLHEKSQLVSVPVPIDSILSFSKEQARPERVTTSVSFLDREQATSGEATQLFIAAFDYQPQLLEQEESHHKTFEIPVDAIPKEYFPPCITTILEGMKDGKKRSLFTLINFLRGVGWSFELIEEELRAWNDRNDEPLREVNIKGRLRYERTKKEHAPPHNCRRYYEDFGVCKPDSLCNSIKNPLQYAKKKALLAGVGRKGARARLTDEQKAARKAHRERTTETEQPTEQSLNAEQATER